MPTIPTDALFSTQWHLRNLTVGELDLNVINVWDEYTGAGVDVAVIDTGYDRFHGDFDNFDFTRDWDFIDNDEFADAETASENHGTAVMGIIGAASDGYGAVGVAYGATLVGYRIGFTGALFSSNTAAAINQSVTDNVEVVNMSIGYSGDFVTGSGINSVITAIENAIDNGRSSYGSILVKSAGNDRNDVGESDDTNDAPVTAHRGTIAVAAVDQDGTVSNYSTHGASVLISAFGSPANVVTTDRRGTDGYDTGNSPTGDHTQTFNGTSAAAPMVSGVVALMLEANSNLGWRDVQDILAYSARHVGTAIGGGTSGSEEYAWIWNGANNWNGGGLHFSADYGFGLIDAHAAVRMAEMWDRLSTSANDYVTFESFSLPSPVVIPDGNLAGTNFVMNEATARHIEHVRVTIDFSTTYIGDVEIYLVSPSGTVSELIRDTEINADLSADWNIGGGIGWDFYSNAFRGEMSNGNWTVRIVDDFSGDVLTVYSIQLRTYSRDTTNTENDTYVYTDEFSDYAGVSGHATTLTDTDGGIDSINAAAVTSGSIIDIFFGNSVIDGVNINISAGIENIYTGDGNDAVYGTSGANMLYTGRGNDNIFGNGGIDTIRAGAGDDNIYSTIDSIIDGGAGYDTLHVHMTAFRNYDMAAHGIEAMTAVENGNNINIAYLIDGSISENAFDTANTQTYDFYSNTYTSTWELALQQFIDDNGNKRNIGYDLAETEVFQYYQNTYNSNDELLTQEILDDNGNQRNVGYDVALTETFTSYVNTYDTQSRLTLQQILDDNGNNRVIGYDVDNLHAWTYYQNTYNPAGDLIDSFVV